MTYHDASSMPVSLRSIHVYAGHVVLPDGNPLIVGGDNIDLDGDFLTNGLKAVREYNYSTTSISNPIELPTGRWYPTLVTLPNGLILIVGGSQVDQHHSFKPPAELDRILHPGGQGTLRFCST